MRKVLIIAIMALALVGCNEPKPIVGQHQIGFASQMPRTIIEGVEDLRKYDMRLYGTYTLDGLSARLFDAERLYYNAEIPGWDYDTPQYWIMGASYRFCAVSPYEAPCTYSDAEGKVTLGSYEGSTGGPDLLYAVATRNLKDNEDFSTVFLNFRHACAAVQFNIINASNAVLTDVRNIRLVGLQNRGFFYFDTEGMAMWNLDGTTISDVAATQPYGGACTLPEGGLPVNINVRHSLYDNGAILVLPQTIYKTSVTLHMEYIKNGDSSYAVRNIELGKLGGTTPTEWKPGEKYEYTLTITDNTITTEVRVVDWIDHYVDL